MGEVCAGDVLRGFKFFQVSQVLSGLPGLPGLPGLSGLSVLSGLSRSRKFKYSQGHLRTFTDFHELSRTFANPLSIVSQFCPYRLCLKSHDR